MKSLMKDVNGNDSSKRYAGYAVLAVAVVGGFVGAIMKNAMLVDFCKWLGGGGVLALIATVAERKS